MHFNLILRMQPKNEIINKELLNISIRLYVKLILKSPKKLGHIVHDFSIYPSANYETDTLLNNICILLVSREIINIKYMYLMKEFTTFIYFSLFFITIFLQTFTVFPLKASLVYVHSNYSFISPIFHLLFLYFLFLLSFISVNFFSFLILNFN